MNSTEGPTQTKKKSDQLENLQGYEASEIYKGLHGIDSWSALEGGGR